MEFESRRAEWSEEGKRVFLEAFRESGMVTAAAKVAGVAKSTVYLHRQKDEAFAVAWADVLDEAVEKMEREAYRRAVEGVEKPVVSAGKLVARVTEHSDGLLMFLMKAHRPERYRENVKVEHSGRITRRTEIDLSKLTDEQLGQLEAIRDALEA